MGTRRRTRRNPCVAACRSLHVLRVAWCRLPIYSMLSFGRCVRDGLGVEQRRRGSREGSVFIPHAVLGAVCSMACRTQDEEKTFIGFNHVNVHTLAGLNQRVKEGGKDSVSSDPDEKGRLSGRLKAGAPISSPREGATVRSPEAFAQQRCAASVQPSPRDLMGSLPLPALQPPARACTQARTAHSPIHR